MSCDTDLLWQPSVAAYLTASTDFYLVPWWENKTQSSNNVNFANELAKSFGDHPVGIDCGIGEECPGPSCLAYVRDGDPTWSYHAMLSTSNLNGFFNDIMDGITDSQLIFSNDIDHIATVAIPNKDPKFKFGDVAFWFLATLAAVVSFVPLVQPEEAAAIVGGVSAFSAAGIQQVSYALGPSPSIDINQAVSSIQNLRNSTAIFGTKLRQGVETWANHIFTGIDDDQGKSILDYLRGGAYEVDGSLPSRLSIGQFFTAQLMGRAVNSQWSTQKAWVTRMLTDDPMDTSGPNRTKYYSTEEKAVYYTYRYSEVGKLRGHLDELWGMNELSNEPYNIRGSDVTKSSARAWMLGRFNYTNEMALEAIRYSVISNRSATPFEDGPGWAGTFTLPVCDMGFNNWNSQYKDNSSRYGIMPCCCGTGCKDTKEFVKKANLVGFQTLLHACKVQLASTDIEFEHVDYGFNWQMNFSMWWAEADGKSRAGAVLGFILAFPITLIYFGAKGIL